MNRVDKLIDAVEKGADPGFLIEREVKSEQIGSCTEALEQAGYRYVGVGQGFASFAQIWNKGNRWIRLWDDGSWEAGEGSRQPGPSSDWFQVGDSCHDLLRDGWPDIVFY